MLYLAIVLQISSAIAAVLLTQRCVDHRPFAIWSVGTTAATILRAIRAAIVMPGRRFDSPPYVGVQRVFFHIDEALFLASTAGLAAMVIVLFVQRRWLALLTRARVGHGRRLPRDPLS